MTRKNTDKNKDLNYRLIRSAIKFGGARAEAEIEKFKKGRDPRIVARDYSRLFVEPTFRILVASDPFPKEIADIHQTSHRLVSPGTHLQEINWACLRVAQYGAALSSFVAYKQDFELALFTGAYDRASAILDMVERDYGTSIWLIQNRLFTIQLMHGLEAQQRAAKQFSDETTSPNLTWLLYFISKRCIGGAIKNRFQEEIDEALASSDVQPAYRAYLRSKLVTQPFIPIADMCGVLFYETTSSLIDLYESLIIVLQCVAGDFRAPASLRIPLLGTVKKVSSLVSDRRLRNVLRGLGERVTISDADNDIGRSIAFDSYTTGAYEYALTQTDSILRGDPNNVSLLELKARTLARLGRTPEVGLSLPDQLLTLLYEITLRTEKTYSSAYSLMTLAGQYYGHEWANQVKATVLDLMGDVDSNFIGHNRRLALILSSTVSPLSSYAYRDMGKASFDREMKAVAWAPQTRAVLGGESTPDHEASDLYVRGRTYSARHALEKGNYATVVDLLEPIMPALAPFEKIGVVPPLALAYHKTKALRKAANLCVDTYLENPSQLTNLPLGRIAAELEDPDRWFDDITLPLFWEIYSSSYDADRKSHLRVAFENFQTSNSIKSPSDIIHQAPTLGRERVVAYLERVWTPDVMKGTLLYRGNRLIEEARIEVCKALAAFDEENSSIYMSELRDRVKNLEISKTMSLVEQSKIYVDIAAITKSLKSKLQDSYHRYRDISSHSESHPQPEARVLEISGLRFLQFRTPLTEADVAFDAMFAEVTNEFLKSDHGLNVYLSTRIRHGTLNNTLRMPVEVENLVTNRQAETQRYGRNRYWHERFSRIEAEKREMILSALDEFSKRYDELIFFIKDRLLQIQVIDTLKERETSEALFIYHSASFERRYIESRASENNTLDTLIDKCIHLLWKKTDANLELVRHTFSYTVKNQFFSLFDGLNETVNSISSVSLYLPSETRDLLDAIARAKTAFQTQLSNVINWFNRSEVYDRPDYPIALAAGIAMRMVKNTRSQLPPDFELNFLAPETPSETSMPGRTLDALVDLFYTLFENAIAYCELPLTALQIDVEASVVESRCAVRVTNNLSPLADNAAARQKVEKARAALGGESGRRLLQGEGGSGFHKIWRIIHAPTYRDSEMNFGFQSGNSFSVEVSCMLNAEGV